MSPPSDPLRDAYRDDPGRSPVGAGGREPLLVALLALVLVALPPFLFQHRLDDPLGSDARLLTHANRFMEDAEGLRAVWTRDFFEGAETGPVTYRSGYYRPVTNTFLWIVHRGAGTDARAYNVMETLLHGVSSALAMAVVLLVGGSLWMAAGAGLLFAVHPVQAFAATEPAAVADVLFPAFFLASMASFELALGARSRRGRVAGVAASTVFYALAALAKEMGLTLPAVLVLQVVRRRARGGKSLRPLAWTLPAWAVLGAYLGWRFGVLDLPMHDQDYVAEHGLPAVVAAGPKAFLIHLSRALLPLQPGHPELNPTLVNRLRPPWTDPLAWAGAMVTLGFLGAAALLWRRRPDAAFWSAFTLVTFSPLLLADRIGAGLAPDVILTQERWFYLPFLGVVALVVMGGRTLWLRLEQGRPRRVAAVAAVVALGVLGHEARVHAGRHDDPFAQLRTLYLFPEESLSRQELANRLLLYAHFVALPRGDTADALARGRRAVELTPDSPLSAASLATILAGRGSWEEVRTLLEPWYRPSPDALAEAAEAHPRVLDDLHRSAARVALLLGRATARAGEPERALEMLCEARARGAPPGEVEAALGELERLGVDDPRCGAGGGPARSGPGV